MTRFTRLISVASASAVLLAVAGSPLGAQPPATQPPSSQPGDQDPKADAPGDRKPLTPERRKRWREELEHRIERFQQALKALDEGKSIEEVRQMYPDLPRFGIRAEGREQGERGHEEGGDVDRLGPGMMGGGGPRGGSGAPASDQAHPLTAEERQGVRDILGKTSPQLLAHLQDLEKTNPTEAEKKFSESLPRLRFLLDLKKRDAKLYEYKLQDIQHGREAFESARAIAGLDAKNSTDTVERAKFEGLLRKALTDQYNVRTLIIRREAEGIKERSAAMQLDADNRDAQASAVVEKNMKAMVDREKKRMEKHPDKDRHGPAGPPTPGAPGDHKPDQSPS